MSADISEMLYVHQKTIGHGSSFTLPLPSLALHTQTQVCKMLTFLILPYWALFLNTYPPKVLPTSYLDIPHQCITV